MTKIEELRAVLEEVRTNGEWTGGADFSGEWKISKEVYEMVCDACVALVNAIHATIGSEVEGPLSRDRADGEKEREGENWREKMADTDFTQSFDARAREIAPCNCSPIWRDTAGEHEPRCASRLQPAIAAALRAEREDEREAICELIRNDMGDTAPGLIKAIRARKDQP